MTMSAAFEGGLMTDFDLLELLPIEIEMDFPAQVFQLIEFFSPNQFVSGKMDGFSLGLGRSRFHQLLDQVLVEIQRGTHATNGMHSLCICQFHHHSTLPIAGNP